MLKTPTWPLLAVMLAVAGCEERARATPEAPTPAPSLEESIPPTADRGPNKPRPPAWPSASAPLTVAQVAFPKGFGRKRIYLDAGHGAPGNEGIRSPEAQGRTDTLVSQPIDLSPYQPANGLYLSFFWEARGRAEQPDLGDSLVLQFRDNAGRWKTVWAQSGQRRL
ncbi:MAG TPA: hypothetical protein VEY88_08205, partial [Archangium sp.]|nr:hypothetical protein [Archangium sp.]